MTIRWWNRAAFAAVLMISVLGPAIVAASGDVTRSDREDRYRQFIDVRSMVKGGVVDPEWMEDGNRFWYVSVTAGDTAYYMVDCEAGTREPIAAPPAPEDEPEGAAAVNTPDPPASPVEDGAAPEVEETPSPDGSWFVAGKDDNLWYRPAEGGGELKPLTTDGEEDFSWSAEGGDWSGDGARFAVQRFDSRGLHKMPIVKWLGRDEEVEWGPYPYAGEPRYGEPLSIVDLDAGRVVPIDTGDGEGQSYVKIGWRPDDSEYLFLRFAKGMKQVDLMAADPATGAARAIVTDRQDTYIEGLHLYFVSDCFYHPLDGGERFVWRSERDGWAHFYLYEKDGRLVRQLTKGEFEVLKVVADDEDYIYFTGQADPGHPYDRHLYRVDMEGKKMKQLTGGTGRHRVSLAPGLTGFVDNHSTHDRKPAAELRRMDGELVMMLAEADISELEATGWKPPEEFVVKAADGKTDLYGLLYKPHDFDPARGYPLIEVIYAGSQMPAVSRTFVPHEYGFFAQILAQLGYVTVVLDARGTPGRGKEFQDVVYRSIGRNEIPDHVAAIRNLAADRPWIDLERVGVHGKSWGGYFALRAMLQAPGFYKVGVASGVVADLATTAWFPIAPYMESPEKNPEGYAFANCLEWAGKLEGRLLITATTADLNTPFAQAMKMVDAFIQAGKPIDLMVFPDQHHWLEGASLDYFYELLKDYFLEHLPPNETEGED